MRFSAPERGDLQHMIVPSVPAVPVTICHVLSTDWRSKTSPHLVHPLVAPLYSSSRTIDTTLQPFATAKSASHVTLPAPRIPALRALLRFFCLCRRCANDVKIDTISTQFRTFPMEVVAGEPNTEVQSKRIIESYFFFGTRVSP